MGRPAQRWCSICDRTDAPETDPPSGAAGRLTHFAALAERRDDSIASGSHDPHRDEFATPLVAGRPADLDHHLEGDVSREVLPRFSRTTGLSDDSASVVSAIDAVAKSSKIARSGGVACAPARPQTAVAILWSVESRSVAERLELHGFE